MKPSKEHLAIINSHLAGHTMSEDSVEVLPFLVFDMNQTDRYTIMSKEMLAKMAEDLSAGIVAFNRLHQSNSSLPVGSSISGKLVKTSEGYDLHAMMYAVTKRPDGMVFEEGKDLADRYATGAARACSAGVRVGFYKCNVCGNDIRDYDACEHIPGKNYTKDEKPITCIASMTGHKIVDGVAQDCGIYEVSAVTAGGVAAAGSLTEAFGAYEEGADIKEFKKSVADGKQLSLRVEMNSVPTKQEDETLFSQEEEGMEKHEVEQLMKDHYDPLKLEIVGLKDAAEVKAGEFTALQTSFDEQTATLEETVGKYDAAVKELADSKEADAAEVAGLKAFKAAYLAVVAGLAVKAGVEVVEDAYASKTVDELQTLSVEYTAVIADLPSGQNLEGGEGAEETPALNSSFYKI